jgi:hypothetical protein
MTTAGLDIKIKISELWFQINITSISTDYNFFYELVNAIANLIRVVKPSINNIREKIDDIRKETLEELRTIPFDKENFYNPIQRRLFLEREQSFVYEKEKDKICKYLGDILSQEKILME